MNADFYALDHAMPTLAVSNVRFFDLWTVLTAELADYYGEEADSFKLVEASWNNEEEYADVVTLNGRIVGALHRPLTQENVAAIWGVNRMEKRAFVNRIRSLYNIDGDLLRELTREAAIKVPRQSRAIFPRRQRSAIRRHHARDRGAAKHRCAPR